MTPIAPSEPLAAALAAMPQGALPSHSSHSSHTSQPQPAQADATPGEPLRVPPAAERSETDRGRQAGSIPSGHPPQSAQRQTPPTNPLLHHSNTPLCTIGGLAELLGTDRRTIRSYLQRLNFRITTTRVGPRHKRVACLTATQAAAITSAYQTDLALGPELPDETNDPDSPNEQNPAHPDRNLGVIYLLQLEPDFDPHRYKVGFSHRPWQRLNDLLTVAPLAQCLAMWPARRRWERTAIEAISQTSTQIREEVYRADHIANALAAGEKFFASLPIPAPARKRLPLQGRDGAPPPSQTSRCGKAEGGAEVSGSAALRGRPPSSAKHLAKGTSPPTINVPNATRPPAVAPACFKTCGREAAPPGSQTSWCGQAEGGAEPTAPPSTNPPISTKPITPPPGIEKTPRWRDTPWSPNLRQGQAAAGAEQPRATTPARETHPGPSRTDGVSPSHPRHSRSDTLPAAPP